MQKLSQQSILRVTAVCVVLLLWLFVAPITAFFWTIFLIWTAFGLDSRVIGYGAITLLVMIPITLSIELYEWMSEQLAVYVFYLLCITVTLQAIELFREGDIGEEKEDPEEDSFNKVPNKINKKNSRAGLFKIESLSSLTTFIAKYTTPLAFAGLTLLVLGGMLAPGYVLTLDMVWSDASLWSWDTDGFNNGAPVYLLLAGLGLVFPAWVIQKLMLFGLFFSLLYLPYRFLPLIESNAGRWFAGLLYTFNPFVYSRLLSGQWGVLLGYACLPLVLYTLNRLLEKKDLKSGLLFGFSLAVVGLFSIHFLYLSLVLSAIWIGTYVVRSLLTGHETLSKSLLTASLSGLILFVVLSSYWLMPAFNRETPLETRFDITHFASFAASENHLVSTPLNLAVLGGFWAEGDEWRYYFLWPQDQPVFWLASLFILMLVGFGFITLVKNKEYRFVAILLLATGILSYVTALGAWGGAFTSLNLWLYENIPGWSGLRDSHKIAGVLALVYVTFAGIAIDRVVALSKKQGGTSLARTALPILFILPFIFGMYELFGFRDQLTPVEYPTSWYETRAMLETAPSTEKMLVLPWQGYFSLPFNNQLLVANPTSRFFGKEKTIAGRAVSLESVYDQEVDANYRQIDSFLHEVADQSPEAVTEFLRSNNIRYLFVVVNEATEDQNNWLLPPKMALESESEDTLKVSDPRDSKVITGLLQAPHEIITDSDIILYRFTN